VVDRDRRTQIDLQLLGLVVVLCQTVPAAQSTARAAVPELADAPAGLPQARSGEAAADALDSRP
jgi:hypothetical protein